MANQAGNARKFWIAGGALAVIGVVGMIAVDYPPGLQDTAGTIVPAKRFRADGGGTSQLGDSNAAAGNAAGLNSAGVAANGIGANGVGAAGVGANGIGANGTAANVVAADGVNR